MSNELPRPIDPNMLCCTPQEADRARYLIKHAFDLAVPLVGYTAAREILTELLEKTKR